MPKLGPKQGFCHFLKFGSLVFVENAYNDSLQQCVLSSRGAIYEKISWVQIWAKGTKIGPEIRFLAGHFLRFGALVFVEIACNDSL